MLDLRNAFGEVNHKLISAALEQHHLPADIIEMFTNISNNSKVSISYAQQYTSPVRFSRGVLQGDPCSPLLFNICFNSLMRTIRLPRYAPYANLGLILRWSTESGNRQHALLQFADDAIIIADNDKHAQTIINVFSAWCTWADMHIRLDKCCAFGMRKENGNCSRLRPKMFINGANIQIADLDSDFVYIGKRFNENMNKNTAKTNNCITKRSTLQNNKSRTDTQMKIKILKLAIYPK